MLVDYLVCFFFIEIVDVLVGIESLVLIFVDFDFILVCGFIWIYWLVVNFLVNIILIGDDVSCKDGYGFVQGKNSNVGCLVNGDLVIIKGYVGF